MNYNQQKLVRACVFANNCSGDQMDIWSCCTYMSPFYKSYKSYKVINDCNGYNDISMVITVIKKVIKTL